MVASQTENPDETGHDDDHDDDDEGGNWGRMDENSMFMDESAASWSQADLWVDLPTGEL